VSQRPYQVLDLFDWFEGKRKKENVFYKKDFLSQFSLNEPTMFNSKQLWILPIEI